MSYLAKIRSRLKVFGKDDGGSSLIEFAVVIPILLTVLLPGSLEATNALIVKRKTAQTATVLADLATQASSINATSWVSMQSMVAKIMHPFDGFANRMRLMGVKVDADKKITVTWDFGTADLDPNSLPAGLVIANSFYVMAASEVDYEAIFSGMAIGNMTFRDTAVMAPRLSATVELK